MKQSKKNRVLIVHFIVENEDKADLLRKDICNFNSEHGTMLFNTTDEVEDFSLHAAYQLGVFD